MDLNVTLLEEMIASQQFVNVNLLQLLDVVLCCSQREDDFGWLLHLGSWSHVVILFFLGQNDHMKTEHTMQHAELSYVKLSVA